MLSISFCFLNLIEFYNDKLFCNNFEMKNKALIRLLWFLNLRVVAEMVPGFLRREKARANPIVGDNNQLFGQFFLKNI